MKKKISPKKKTLKKTAKKAVKKAIKKSLKTKIKAKPKAKAKGKTKSAIKLKLAGKIEHFFGHILVAAMKLKNPLAVGDVVNIKGHTTDFIQKIESMQIDHAPVQKAQKGQDVGFKVKEKVRAGDMVFFAPKEVVAPKASIQQPLLPTVTPLAPKPQSKIVGGYDGKKFLSF